MVCCKRRNMDDHGRKTCGFCFNVPSNVIFEATKAVGFEQNKTEAVKDIFNKTD